MIVTCFFFAIRIGGYECPLFASYLRGQARQALDVTHFYSCLFNTSDAVEAPHLFDLGGPLFM